MKHMLIVAAAILAATAALPTVNDIVPETAFEGDSVAWVGAELPAVFATVKHGQCPLKDPLQHCCKSCHGKPSHSCEKCVVGAALTVCMEKHKKCKTVSVEGCMAGKEDLATCKMCKECVMGILPRDDRPGSPHTEDDKHHPEEAEHHHKEDKKADPKEEAIEACHKGCEALLHEGLKKEETVIAKAKVGFAKRLKEDVKQCRENCDAPGKEEDHHRRKKSHKHHHHHHHHKKHHHHRPCDKVNPNRENCCKLRSITKQMECLIKKHGGK